MNGMGMLHLEIKQHRMERDFRLKVRVGKPRVSYRETLRKPVARRGRVRPAGRRRRACSPRCGGVRAVPGRASRSWCSRGVPPDALPPEFVAAAEQGIRGALESGELGYPVMNVQAVIVGGEMDEQFSNETAFQAAGADAVHKAMRDNIVLLEPVMQLEVTVPEEYLGPVTADLNARRGGDHRSCTRAATRSVLEALVPAAKMFDYADKVRSLSQGRASPSMEPHAYRPGAAGSAAMRCCTRKTIEQSLAACGNARNRCPP